MFVDPATALKISLGLVNTCKDAYTEIAKATEKYKKYGETILLLHKELNWHQTSLSKWKEKWEIGVGKPGEGKRYFGDYGWGSIQKSLLEIDELLLQLIVLLAPFEITPPKKSKPPTHLRLLPGLSLRSHESTETGGHDKVKNGRLRKDLSRTGKKLTKDAPKDIEAGRKFLESLDPSARQRLIEQNERVADADRDRFMKKLVHVFSKSTKKMLSFSLQIRQKLTELKNDSETEVCNYHTKLPKGASVDDMKQLVDEKWDIEYAKDFRRIARSLFSIFPQGTGNISMDDVGFDLGAHRRPSFLENGAYTFIVKDHREDSSLEVMVKAAGDKEPRNSASIQSSNGLLPFYMSRTQALHTTCQETNSLISWYSITSTQFECEALRFAHFLPSLQSTSKNLNGLGDIQNIPVSERLELSDIWDIAFEILDAALLLLGLEFIPPIHHYNLMLYQKPETQKQLARCCYDFRVSSGLQVPLSDEIGQLELQNSQIESQACSIGILLLELATQSQVLNLERESGQLFLTMSNGEKNNLEEHVRRVTSHIGPSFGDAIWQCFSNLRQPIHHDDGYTRDKRLQKWLEDFYKNILQPLKEVRDNRAAYLAQAAKKSS